jgi:hypothetical protein
MSYREPPLDAITNAREETPELAQKYMDFVEGFFSPPPPSKGYNPVLPVDDPNSPILEDREKISRILSESLQYRVLTSLRNKPLSINDISQKTTLPETIVTKVLHSLESEKVAVHFVENDLWALLTNPRIQSFMPEYVLPIINKKLLSKEITPEAAYRHLELLLKIWGEVK